METLSLTTARDLASACDDPANPAREAAARAMRERWLSEIEAGLLIPDLGVLEVLGGPATVGTVHTRPLTVMEE